MVSCASSSRVQKGAGRETMLVMTVNLLSDMSDLEIRDIKLEASNHIISYRAVPKPGAHIDLDLPTDSRPVQYSNSVFTIVKPQRICKGYNSCCVCMCVCTSTSGYIPGLSVQSEAAYSFL